MENNWWIVNDELLFYLILQKVMTKYVQDADRYKYLQDIIDDELSTNARLVTEALLWLKRFMKNNEAPCLWNDVYASNFMYFMQW